MRWRTEPSHQGLKAQSVGEDRHGNVYWYFYGTRLYREANAKKPLFSSDYWEEEWKRQKDKKFEKIGKRPGRPRKTTVPTSNVKGPPRLSQWTTVCSSPEEWHSFAQKFQSSPCPQERKLYQVLVKEFLPQWENRPRTDEEQLGDPRKKRPVTSTTTAELIPQVIVKKRGRKPKTVPPPPPNTNPATRGRKRKKIQQQTVISEPEEEDEEIPEEEEEDTTLNKDLQAKLQRVIDRVKIHREVWPFLQPVEEEYAPGYYQMIKEPMDVSLMQEQISAGGYNDHRELEQDFKTMVLNCEKYNGEESDYTSMAYTLWRVFRRELRKYFGAEHEIDILSTEDSNSDDSAHQRKRRKKPSGLEAMEVLALAAQQALREYSSPEKDANLQTILLPGQSTPKCSEEGEAEEDPKAPELDSIPLSVLLNEEETSIEKINQLVADIGKTINTLQTQEGTLVIRSHGSASQSPSSTTVIEVTSIPQEDDQQDLTDSQEQTTQEALPTNAADETTITDKNATEESNKDETEKNVREQEVEEANGISSSKECEKSVGMQAPDSSMLLHQDITLPSLNQMNTLPQNDDLIGFQTSMRGLPIYQDEGGTTFHVLQGALPNYPGMHNSQSISPPSGFTLSGTGLSPVHISPTFADMQNLQPPSPISNLRISPPFSSNVSPNLPLSPNQSRIANLQICSSQPRITSLQQFGNMTSGAPVQAFLTPQIYPLPTSNSMTSAQNAIITCSSNVNFQKTGNNTFTSAGNLQMMLPYNTSLPSVLNEKNFMLVEASPKGCGGIPSQPEARASMNTFLYPRIAPRPVTTYALGTNDFTNRQFLETFRHTSAIPLHSLEIPHQAIIRR